MEGQSILVYDERVDYYSLGILLQELAFGEGHFEDRYERASVGGLVRNEVDPDSDFVNFMEEVFAPLCITCTQPNGFFKVGLAKSC